VGAIVAEQVRAITLAAEESAADIRRRAEEKAEHTNAAAGEMRARMERLEEVVLELVASRRREAEMLSRLVEQGRLSGPESEDRLALPPTSEGPQAPSAEEMAGSAEPRTEPGPPTESAEIGLPAPSGMNEPAARSSEPAERFAPTSRSSVSDDATPPGPPRGDREEPTAPARDRPDAGAHRENGLSTGDRRGHPSERDANVGVLLSRIRTRRSSASVSCPPCTVCRRDFGGSVKQAGEDGWHVVGEEALCDRCANAGWRLPDDSPPGRVAGRG